MSQEGLSWNTINQWISHVGFLCSSCIHQSCIVWTKSCRQTAYPLPCAFPFASFSLNRHIFAPTNTFFSNAFLLIVRNKTTENAMVKKEAFTKKKKKMFQKWSFWKVHRRNSTLWKRRRIKKNVIYRCFYRHFWTF